MKNQRLTSQALKSKPKRKDDGVLNTGSVRRLIGVCVCVCWALSPVKFKHTG